MRPSLDKKLQLSELWSGNSSKINRDGDKPTEHNGKGRADSVPYLANAPTFRYAPVGSRMRYRLAVPYFGGVAIMSLLS